MEIESVEDGTTADALVAPNGKEKKERINKGTGKAGQSSKSSLDYSAERAVFSFRLVCLLLLF